MTEPSFAALAKAREIVRDNTFVDRIHWELIPEIALALDAWRAQALEEAVSALCSLAEEEQLNLLKLTAAIRALAPPTTLSESETP